jgi:hypothetical protein
MFARMRIVLPYPEDVDIKLRKLKLGGLTVSGYIPWLLFRFLDLC